MSGEQKAGQDQRAGLRDAGAGDAVPGPDHRDRHRVRRRTGPGDAVHAPARQGARGRGDVAVPLRQRPGGSPRRDHRPPGGRAAPGPPRPAARHRPTAGRPTCSGWRTGCAPSPAQHPNVFPLIATRHPAAPWLRPPLRSLRVVEDFLSVLISRGFSDTRAVIAYRAFSSFLLGHLLLESSMLGAQTSPAEEPLDEGESDVPNEDQKLDLDGFPHIQRLEVQLSEDHAAPEFEQALEDLLDRLDRLIAG